MKSLFPIRRGMALVITLAAVVLITTLILAFFSRARINRQISYASLNNIQSDLLARSALDIVIGELREEIRVSSTAQNGGNSAYPRIFKPKTTASLLPQRSGIDDLTSAGSANLLAVSSSGAPLYSLPGTSGRILGSSVAISATSANGRSFPASRWFGDNYGPCLGSQSTLPSWAFVTRNNGIRANPAIADAKDPSKNDCVIGRFAFTVYDISGLLNVNVAGYPSSAATQAGYKSSQAYAVLTELPGFTTASVDALTNWRNSTDAGSESAYSAYLANWGKRYGFLQMKLGHNAFFSRHDLLSAASGTIAGISSSALTDLTTFSRTLIAPDTTPPTQRVGGEYANSTTDYASLADASASANRNLPNVRFVVSGTVAHYRDDGSTEKYTVTAGDPLVQRRFSLGKLAWLTCRGPSARLTPSDTFYNAGGSADAIQACFGLTWDLDEERWLYVGNSGNTLQTEIKTLAQVALEKREPNFFELLKAGILVGSLGTNSSEITVMGTAKVGGVNLQQYYDQKTDLQVLRIGANIIDCADSTNYPTRIAISSNYPSLGTKTTEVAGIKDLPYLQTLLVAALRQGTAVTGTTTLTQQMDYVWVPMLFNPHRATATSASEGPTSLQFSFTSGLLANISDPVPVEPNTDLSQQPALTINANQFELFRSKPSVITSASDPNSLGLLVDYATGDKDVICWLLYSFKESGKLPGEYTNKGFLVKAASNVMISSKYTSPGGKWRTYSTLWNSESLAGNNGNLTVTNGMYHASISDLAQSHFINHWDPRTNRFGPAMGWTRKPSDIPPVSLSELTWGCARNQTPFVYTGSYPYYLYALWPEGAKKQGDSGDYFRTNFANNDSLYRPADAWLGPDANPYRDRSTTNTTSNRRPVILHRPYRSVAELGYVFRDEAWKTLDFFDGSSGDSALLALFSVADEPSVTADLVHLDSRTSLTHQALLSNASQEHSGTAPLTNPQAIASAFNSYAFLSGTPSDTMPLNVSQTADYLMSLNGNSAVGLDVIKYRREAVVRALANNTQTRTWNLLIDVAAQTGRYASSAQSLDQFVVDGEKRYWLSVAIDRYTGKIVDQQLEPAND